MKTILKTPRLFLFIKYIKNNHIISKLSLHFWIYLLKFLIWNIFRPKQIFRKLHVKRGFQNYCSNSTLHGLKYVGDQNLTLFERLFWLMSFFIAVGFALYFIYNLYKRYDQSPVIVSFNPKLVTITEIPFPAVTICNVNIALKSRAEFLNAHG